MALQKCDSIKLEHILNNFGGTVSGPAAFLRLICFYKEVMSDTLPLGIYQILLRGRGIIKTLG